MKYLILLFVVVGCTRPKTGGLLREAYPYLITNGAGRIAHNLFYADSSVYTNWEDTLRVPTKWSIHDSLVCFVGSGFALFSFTIESTGIIEGDQVFSWNSDTFKTKKQ